MSKLGITKLKPVSFRTTAAGQHVRKPRTLRLGAGKDGELRLALEDLWKGHSFVLGGSGRGKSVLLFRLATALLHEHNVGMAILDPHAQLAEGVLRHVATLYPSLAKRIVVLDPSGQLGGGEHVLGLNPLSMGDREEEYVLGSMQTALLHAWNQHDANATPRLVRALANLFHTVRSCGLTVAETLPLLDISKRSPERERLLAGIRNRLVEVDLQTLESSSISTRLEQLESALNRLRKFLLSPITRNILGAKKRVLDLSAVFEESKILIVNLSGGQVLSRELTRSLGCLMLAELFRAARGRDLTNPRLKPFTILVDEAGQLMTEDLASMMEELRKFKVGIVAAAQSTDQFRQGQRDILKAVVSNTRTKIVMGCSHEDAVLLSDEVSVVDPHKVKEERYTVRERHIEETRKVVTRSHQTGKSRERSVSSSDSETKTETDSSGTTDTKSSQKTTTRSHQLGTQLSSSTTSGSSSSEHASQLEGEPGATPHVTSGTGSGQTQSSGQQTGVTASSGESEADGSGTAKSTKQEHSTARGWTRSKGTTYGEGESEQHGVAEAEVPFHRVEEVPELASKTYYTLEELKYLDASAIQNQGIGEATVKLQGGPAVRIRLDYASPPPFNPRVTPQLMERLWKQILEANGAYYQSLDEARREMAERQTAFFGAPLVYELPEVEATTTTTTATDVPAQEVVLEPTERNRGPFEV